MVPRDSMAGGSTFPPRAAILLPMVLLLHQAEEWLAGFPDWAGVAFGIDISPDRFLSINSIGFLIFAIGTAAAFTNPGMAWLITSLAALIGLNGILHCLFTVVLGTYSPGTVTGLLLFIPMSAIVLLSSWAQLSRITFLGAVFSGVLLHGLATFWATR